jgi:hypothetical protein
MAAPGTAAPEGSLTRPVISPNVCAAADPAMSAKSSANSSVFIVVPLFLEHPSKANCFCRVLATVEVIKPICASFFRRGSAMPIAGDSKRLSANSLIRIYKLPNWRVLEEMKSLSGNYTSRASACQALRGCEYSVWSRSRMEAFPVLPGFQARLWAS